MKTATILTLAAAAAALPQKRQSTLSDSEFTLQIRLGQGADAPLSKLCAIPSSNEDLLLLAVDKTGSGSPAYFNGTSPDAALNLDVNGISYGLFVGDEGDKHGAQETIPAQKGYQDLQWSYSNESTSIGHQLTSAAPWFLACNITVNGQEETVLSWGSAYLNGSYPAGCSFTSLSRSCDVMGSAAVC